jgi:hypothetical protein
MVASLLQSGEAIGSNPWSLNMIRYHSCVCHRMSPFTNQLLKMQTWTSSFQLKPIIKLGLSVNRANNAYSTFFWATESNGCLHIKSQFPTMNDDVLQKIRCYSYHHFVKKLFIFTAPPPTACTSQIPSFWDEKRLVTLTESSAIGAKKHAKKHANAAKLPHSFGQPISQLQSD